MSRNLDISKAIGYELLTLSCLIGHRADDGAEVSSVCYLRDVTGRPGCTEFVPM